MKTVLIIGSGDIGTACALRLFHAGFRVIILESEQPLDIHHTRTFSEVAYLGYKAIQGVTARTIANVIESDDLQPDSTLTGFVRYQLTNREIAFIALPDASGLTELDISYAVVTQPEMETLIKAHLSESVKRIGFIRALPDNSYHYAIAADDRHYGNVVYPFLQDEISAQPEKTLPVENTYPVKAPIEGVFTTIRTVNEQIIERDEIGKINDIAILAPASGRLSGLLNSGIIIKAKTIFAEISLRRDNAHFHIIPKEAFCLAGGVLEAIMYDLKMNT